MSSATAVPGTIPTHDAVIPAAAAECPSCGLSVLGAYCHGCGEHAAVAGDRSVRRFLREGLAELSSLDSPTLRSLRCLAFRPGLLTLEWMRGRRRPYVGPLKLFLLTFAVASLLYSVAGEAATPESMRGMGEAQLRPFVERVAAAQGVTAEAAYRLLSATVRGHMAWLRLAVPLFFALFVQMVFVRRRRFFGEHLVFATHFAAFNYLLGLVLLPLQVVAARLGDVAALPVSLALTVGMFAYMGKAVGRVYGGTRWGAGWRAVALLTGFMLAQLATALLGYGTSLAALVWLK